MDSVERCQQGLWELVTGARGDLGGDLCRKSGLGIFDLMVMALGTL